jgi:Fur family peroxide stress response transcriptional regulator
MKKLNTDEALNLFYEKCKEHGLKVTPQRVCVYRELAAATDHPSIDDVYQRVKKSLPNISFDTVYRTALSLTEIGIVDVIEGQSGSRRFDANTLPHYHFRCLKCHCIMDFDSSYYDRVTVPEELQKRFRVVSQRIILDGICDACAASK